MQQIPGLYVAPSDVAGRGVFTAHDIPADSVIEIAPVIVIPAEQTGIIHNTALHDYYFRWGADQKACAIALGLASLYNHAYEPNMLFELDYGNATIDFRAHRDIAAGEELTFNYNGDPDDRSPLWFT